MTTLVAFTGFEFGKAEGIGTGTAGNRVFDGITGTAGTDVKVSSGARTGGTGNYVGEINLTAKNFFWDTNTLGTSKTVLVVSMYFRLTTLPSGDTDIISMDTAASTDRAGFFYKQSTGKLHAWISTSNQASTATISVNTWYKLQWRFDVSGTQFLDWSLDGVAGTQVTGGASSTIARVAFGNRGAGTGTAQYDDVAASVTSGDHPLTAYKVPPVLVPDTGGTAVEIGTANATARFVTNSSVDATFNSANILTATSEVPPTIGASASGVAQRTSGAGNAVGLPMTTYTLTGGETIDGTRIIVCGWAGSALANNYGMRAYNGSAETTLIGDVASSFTNSTTAPDWACKFYTGLTDQTTIDALVVRLGYSTDVSPTPGAHAVYAELAIVPGSGGATVTPPVVAGVGAVPAPTISGAATVVPAVVAGVGTVPAPTLAAGSTVTPAAVAGVGAVPAPTLAAGSTVLPSAVAGVGTVPAPVVSGGAAVVPAAVQGVGTVPAPAVSAGGSANVTPTTVAGVGAVPAPSLSAGSTVTPAAVQGFGTIPAPAISAGSSATVTPATVAGTGVVPAPMLSADAATAPGTVAGVGAVPPPVVSAASTVSPPPVAGTGAVPAPTLAVGTSIAPATVRAVGSISSPVVNVPGATAPRPLLTHVAEQPRTHVRAPVPSAHVRAPVPLTHVAA